MDLNQYLNPETLGLIQTGGYLVMFGLMVLEGPLVTFAGAFLASLGIFDIYVVFLLGWFGDIVGDLLFYSIGRYGLHIFHKKTTADTPEGASLVHKLDHLIHTNLSLAIMIIKFTPYAPPIGLTYIGKIGVPIRKYLLASALLCIPIPLIATLAGFHLGYINQILSRYTGWELFGALSVSLLSIAGAVVLFFYLRKKSAKILKAEDAAISPKNPKSIKSDVRASRVEM